MSGRTYNDKMFISTFERNFTWLNGFLRAAEKHAGKNALLDPLTGRSWTYSMLDAESNRLARALREDGIGKNSVVMSALRNCPEFVFSYIAARKIGAILLAANSNLASAEMAMLMDKNKPEIVLYSANIADVVSEAQEISAHKARLCIVCDNIERIAPPQAHRSYEDYTAGKSPAMPEPDFEPHIYDEVLRLCTSGTSALPKSVPLNEVNEVLSAHDVIMNYPLNSSDVTLNLTPWFHRGGIHAGGPCPTLYAGACVAIMRSFSPRNALEWIERHGVTFLIGAPANVEMLSRTQQKQPFDLSKLRGIITMGSPLTRENCIRYMETLSKNIFNGYGTTETFWNCFLTPQDLPQNAGSAGRSCMDDDVRVARINPSGFSSANDMVPKDGISEGEILIRSAAKASLAYFENEREEKARFRDGWMHTGDIGVWNEECFVTIKGRKDDMMVVSGENIFPAQIEEAVNKLDKVRDCVATSVPDEIRGEAVALYVEKADPSLTIDELSAFCRKSNMLSKYKRPRYFSFIDEIPRTASGKKIRSKIKEKAASDLKNSLLKKM